MYFSVDVVQHNDPWTRISRIVYAMSLMPRVWRLNQQHHQPYLSSKLRVETRQQTLSGHGDLLEYVLEYKYWKHIALVSRG